jgi:hypothetical protein
MVLHFDAIYVFDGHLMSLPNPSFRLSTISINVFNLSLPISEDVLLEEKSNCPEQASTAKLMTFLTSHTLLDDDTSKTLMM